MSEVNQKVLTLADKLKGQMTLGDNGVVTVDAKAFESTLDGADLKMEQVKALQDHRDNYVAAQGLALGQIAVEAFKKDKNLTQVSVDSKIHKDIVGSVVTREKTYPGTAMGGGESVTKYGVLASKVQVNGAGNRGQMKLVRQNIAELAAKTYGNL